MDIVPFVRAVAGRGLNCEGVIVMQGGKKTAEHRWIPEAPRNAFSVSKSFVSVAVGMAVDAGNMRLGDRVCDAFPESVPDYKAGSPEGEMLAALNLGHLLSMTRGHGEFSRPETVAGALAQPFAYAPGSRFVYDNGSTFLASAMFTRATGRTVRDCLLDALFRPLGIADPAWPESPDGHTVGASGIMLTTSDLARFGQFLLRRGLWEGRQLVSPGWIDGASRPHVVTGSDSPDWGLGYGLCFWPCRHGAFRADGKDGQFAVVLPRQDAVVAINADETDTAGILNAVWEEILPAL